MRAGSQDVENQLPQGKGDSELVQQVSAPESSMMRGDLAELEFGGVSVSSLACCRGSVARMTWGTLGNFDPVCRAESAHLLPLQEAVRVSVTDDKCNL
jgi:hypothetical protein